MALLHRRGQSKICLTRKREHDGLPSRNVGPMVGCTVKGQKARRICVWVGWTGFLGPGLSWIPLRRAQLQRLYNLIRWFLGS